MSVLRHTLTLLLSLVTGISAQSSVSPFPPHLVGNVSAVVALIDRVVPASDNGYLASSHFVLSLSSTACSTGSNCFSLSDTSDNRTAIVATTASELSAGVGYYLREYCGMTVGWARGGGSFVFHPNAWPSVGGNVTRARLVPYSHVTQVCTHSYTLVWHNWTRWEQFIDWMALVGHNSIVAPTGQEELQYAVLTEKFGLSDLEVRNWTNGPAWLTWSRGQNSHGNGIGGPLPRSFMKQQYALQKQILGRYRELGIAGHLPAFQGNAPWALAVRQNATGRIARGTGAATDTAWIDGRDPLYTAVATEWAARVVEEFGSDHVWQCDAFFGNGTSWGGARGNDGSGNHNGDYNGNTHGNNHNSNDNHHNPNLPGGDDGETHQPTPRPAATTAGTCKFSAPYNNTYLAGCPNPPNPCPSYGTLAAAQAACTTTPGCSGITSRRNGKAFELRAGKKPLNVPAADQEASYVLLNPFECQQFPPDAVWHDRAAAAFAAIVKADGEEARWIYQGWALGVGFGGPTPTGLSRLQGFTSAVPQNQFILLDMSVGGEWRQWQGTWGLPFIWTALHTFGGDLSLAGNLTSLGETVPYTAPPLAPMPTNWPKASNLTAAVGVGYTPEGLDQNPAYFEVLQEAAFRSGPIADMAGWVVERAHRRYGLSTDPTKLNPDVTKAWHSLLASGYAHNEGVSDETGVGILPGKDLSFFGKDLHTPAPKLCLEWSAWGNLVDAGAAVQAQHPTALPEPFVYDLVNTGREVLAQLTTPVSVNFSSAFGKKPPLDSSRINDTGSLYVDLLLDLDALLVTDQAFLLGSWLEEARALGAAATDYQSTNVASATDAQLINVPSSATDCNTTILGLLDCADFMEWNARSQLTTWYPTVSPDAATPGQQGGRDGDYARKQWNGLVRDYYAARAQQYLEQALSDAAAGKAFDTAAMARREARLSYEWQTSFGKGDYATVPQGDPLAVSKAMRSKWAPYFKSCDTAI